MAEARFLLIAFGVTWVGVAPLVLSQLGVGPPWPAWLHGVGALGPLLAAVLSPGGRRPFRARGDSGLPSGVLAVCLLTPVLFAGVALAFEAMAGTPVVPILAARLGNGDWVAGLLVGSVLYGLGEEPGWRGWLLPRLQTRYPAVTATVLLTVIWGAWHAPFFVYRFDFEGPVTILGFFVGLLAGAFWLTFLFNSTGGSVWTVAAWHTLWNVVNIGLAPVSARAVGVVNGLMMVLGFGTWLAFRRRGLSIDGRVITADGVLVAA